MGAGAISNFRSGEHWTDWRHHLNEMVAALNSLRTLAGDGLIMLGRTAHGWSFRLNVEELQGRISEIGPIQAGQVVALYDASGNTYTDYDTDEEFPSYATVSPCGDLTCAKVDTAECAQLYIEFPVMPAGSDADDWTGARDLVVGDIIYYHRIPRGEREVYGQDMDGMEIGWLRALAKVFRQTADASQVAPAPHTPNDWADTKRRYLTGFSDYNDIPYSSPPAPPGFCILSRIMDRDEEGRLTWEHDTPIIHEFYFYNSTLIGYQGELPLSDGTNTQTYTFHWFDHKTMISNPGIANTCTVSMGSPTISVARSKRYDDSPAPGEI
jgi:hypothetical protein